MTRYALHGSGHLHSLQRCSAPDTHGQGGRGALARPLVADGGDQLSPRRGPAEGAQGQQREADVPRGREEGTRGVRLPSLVSGCFLADCRGWCRKKDLTGEESLVLGHIQAAGNEGASLYRGRVGLIAHWGCRDMDEACQGQDGASPDDHRPLPQVSHPKEAREMHQRQCPGMSPIYSSTHAGIHT